MECRGVACLPNLTVCQGPSKARWAAGSVPEESRGQCLNGEGNGVAFVRCAPSTVSLWREWHVAWRQRRDIAQMLLIGLAAASLIGSSTTPPFVVRPARALHSQMAVDATATGLMQPVAVYEEVTIASPSEGPPQQEITVVDLMPYINAAVTNSGMREGSINVISKHTTCAITINEWESRLARDLKTWLLQLAPPDDRSTIGVAGKGVSYEHNDIDQRPESEDERQRARLRSSR